jgi:hypothetical protein
MPLIGKNGGCRQLAFLWAGGRAQSDVVFAEGNGLREISFRRHQPAAMFDEAAPDGAQLAR